MERNTLLAIVLCAFVLIVYQSIFVAPKQVEQQKNSQLIDKQQLTSNEAVQPASPVINQTDSTIPLEKPISYTISTDKSQISFTNVGGSLHNVEFLDKKDFPVTDILSIQGLNNVQYSSQRLDLKNIYLNYSNKGLQVIKTFTVENPNIIKVRMEIKNLSEMSILSNFVFTAIEIDSSRLEINQNNNRDNSLLEYSVYSGNNIFRKGSAYKFNDKNNKSQNANLNWIGFRDRYNAIIIKPEFETKSYDIRTDSDKQLNISFKPQDRSLAPGESADFEFTIYLGPQNPALMNKYNKEFSKIVAFSGFPIIEWIAQVIYQIIPFLHSIFKSWGIAIILISMMIYGISYPLTKQSMLSMRKMQEVQPKINALRERYKNDAQKLNVEMMEIYRREKINPFGGCLPMLLQMPFFMALYQILWRAQYLEGQGFLWIKDLSQPDRLINFPFNLPLIGNELNILPILTGTVMFLQQKISSKSMMVTDEQQAMQQKMMMYMMPLLMVWMFYKFASSWAIYFLVYYSLSTVVQWKMSGISVKK